MVDRFGAKLIANWQHSQSPTQMVYLVCLPGRTGVCWEEKGYCRNSLREYRMLVHIDGYWVLCRFARNLDFSQVSVQALSRLSLVPQ